MLAVTQPRKVAARALAYRVAEEMNCNVGKMVFSYNFIFFKNFYTKLFIYLI